MDHIVDAIVSNIERRSELSGLPRAVIRFVTAATVGVLAEEPLLLSELTEEAVGIPSCHGCGDSMFPPQEFWCAACHDESISAVAEVSA